MLFGLELYAAAVKSIVVKGNKKIEDAAIIQSLETKQGKSFNRKRIRQDIQNIFDLGYFYDVKVHSDDTRGGVRLTYEVLEKPSIAEIKFSGNSEVSEEDLKEAAGIKNYSIINLSEIQSAIDKMQKLYEDKGFFLSQVTYRLEEITGDKNKNVRLVFEIVESDKVIVKRINIIGNSKITDATLIGRMGTQEGGLFSFFSGSGSYKQEIFDRDLQAINFSYFNEGYIKAKVDRPEVFVSPDKKSIHISIKVDEGEQYQVGNINFAGDLLFTDAELREVIAINKEETFIYGTIQKDLLALQAKYGDLGYAYANIIPQVSTRDDVRKADVTFRIDKGEKVYFGRFNVVGNSKTRDKVVRRELKILEGELYNETNKRKSLESVRRLGFFEEVNFKQITPPGQPNLMDIEIVVKERTTGSIQVGAGYSSYNGFILNGSVDQKNLRGLGQKLSASINYSKQSSLFSVNFTEPYFLDSKWSVGVEAYKRERTLQQAYKEKRYGGSLRVGHPLAEYLRGYLSYRYDYANLEPVDGSDTELYPTSTADGVTSSTTASIEYDKRDDRISPKNGIYSSLSFQYAGIGGDKKFTKTFLNVRYYKNIFWDVVFRNNITYGRIDALDGKEIPFNELFLVGGPNSVRGYSWFTVGRRKFSRVQGEYRPFGGAQQFYYNLELEFPMVREANIKGVVFYDIGDAQDTLETGDFRSGVGFGFRWQSPLGPLRFEWGFPLDRDKVRNEPAKTRIAVDPVRFDFNIGSPF